MGSDDHNEQAERMYWATLNKNHMNDSEENRFMFNRGYYLGAQYAMRTSTALSPHIARFMEFVMWLTEREYESE